MVHWHLINKISNSISLLLWAGLALKIASRLVADYPNYLHSDHTQEIKTLRIIQGFQTLSILVTDSLIKTLPSIINSLMLIIKMFIIFYFLQPQTGQSTFIFLALSLSLWECLCRVYSLFQNTTQIYQNMFILLYPLKVYFSYSIIKNYYDRNQITINNKQAILIWFCIVVHVGFSIYSYAMMWGRRIRYYERIQKDQETYTKSRNQ